MKCPNCNANDFYEGIMGPNCINQNCFNFKGEKPKVKYYFSYSEGNPYSHIIVCTKNEIVFCWGEDPHQTLLPTEVIEKYKNNEWAMIEETDQTNYIDWFTNNHWNFICDENGNRIKENLHV